MQAVAGQRLSTGRVGVKRMAIRRTVGPRAAFELKPPPYPMDALEPLMSKNTFDFHWGKHHRAYVDNLNNQIKGTPLEKKSLEEVVVESWNNGSPTPVFNNAAQAWNHTFFWESMKPNGGGQPAGELMASIKRDFGSFEEFTKQFKAAGATQFGSGWAWLVTDSNGKLSVVKTANAENPLAIGNKAILTMDVWEHAYYLDVQNKRPAYIDTFVDKLIDWDSVAARYAAAT